MSAWQEKMNELGLSEIKFQLLLEDMKKLQENPNIQSIKIDKELYSSFFDKGTKHWTPEWQENYRKLKERQREEERKEKEIEDRQKRIEQGRGEHFIKCFTKPIHKLNWSAQTAGNFIDLIQYLQFQSVKGTYLIQGGKPMSFRKIQEALERSQKDTRKVLDQFIKDEVLYEEKHPSGSKYHLNSEYHIMGRDREEDSREFVKLYKKKFQEVTDGLTKAQKGIIYKILPYFHINEYFLCKNPLEPHLDKIDYFNASELANLIGMDKSNFSRQMKALRDKGIMGTFDCHGVKAIYVHPDLVFRKDILTDEEEEHYEKVKSYFKKNEEIKKKEIQKKSKGIN